MLSYLVPVLGFLFVFGLVVLVHEVGHFVFAKSGDVQVDAFSIGMGPKLFSYTYGETEYKISLLPLGGFVSMAGEDPEEAGDNPRAFYNKSIGNRLLILFAGCLFNFLLGYVIFVGMGLFLGEVKVPAKVGYVSERLEIPVEGNGEGERSVEAPAHGKLQVGDKIIEMNDYEINEWQDIQVRGQLLGSTPRKLVILRDGKRQMITIDPVKDRGERLNQPRYIMGIQPYHPPEIGRLRDEGKASELGLREGDEIAAINDQRVRSWEELTQYLRENPGTHELVVQRNNSRTTKTIEVPDTQEAFREWFSEMGWAPPIEVKRYGLLGSFGYGARQTVHIVKLMYETVVGLITQTISPQSLAGPVGIAHMTGQVSQQGILSLLYFTAFFSINLGVINLLPIPVLDGGHILLTLPELLTGRSLPDRVVGTINYLGIILILSLLVYVTKVDLCRYEWFSQYFEFICR